MKRPDKQAKKGLKKPATEDHEVKLLLQHLNNPISILDNRKGKLIFANQPFLNMTGLSTDEVYKITLEDFLKRMHAKDLIVYLNEVLGEVRQACTEYIYKKKQQVIFTINYRFMQPDGKYIHVMVQNTVLEWFNDLQRGIILSLFSDITDHKKDHKIILTINVLADKEKKWTLVFTKEFFAVPEMLSNREREIMKLIVQEHTAARIAEILNLKFYTVRAHWRNILNKVGCKSQKELKQIANREAWV